MTLYDSICVFFKPIRRVIRREILEKTNPLRSVLYVLLPLSVLLFCMGWDSHNDPMAATGVITVIGGLLFGHFVDRDQFKLITDLRDAGLIELDGERERNIKSRLRKTTFLWQCLMAILVTICTVWAYNLILDLTLDSFDIASLICAVLIGLRLGRGAANGFTGRALVASSVSFQMTTEHPDRTGGLSGIGNFYLLQAVTVLIPSLWLAVWIYVIHNGNPIPNGYDYNIYAMWKDYFVGLLVICIVIFAFSMVVPMRSFRRMIACWKEQRGPAIEALGKRAFALNSQVYQNLATRNRMREISTHLHCFNHISDWGISPVVRTTFLSTFLTLLLSALTLIVSLSRSDATQTVMRGEMEEARAHGVAVHLSSRIIHAGIEKK